MLPCTRAQLEINRMLPNEGFDSYLLVNKSNDFKVVGVRHGKICVHDSASKLAGKQIDCTSQDT